MTGIKPEALRAFGAQVDFGKTAADYASHRAGFPPDFFDALAARGHIASGLHAVDLGTGTGTIARGLALRGLRVTGVDPAQDLMHQAAKLDEAAGTHVSYVTAQAEATGLPDQSADLITAGQCWHWFDRPRAANEVNRLLVPGGRLIIAHFDWLPMPGSLVAATEALILRHNPDWAGAGGTGIYPDWLTDMAQSGFSEIETTSFDTTQSYSARAWRGRIRASAGIAASLDPAAVVEFDAELAALMVNYFPEDPLDIPHRVWWVTGRKL